MSVNIKGKEYVLVNERLIEFRKIHEEFSLETDIIEMSPERVVMKASIKDPEGRVLATGHAYEDSSSSFINKTSYIENCETSAWGRALANFGIGLDTSVASYEEVANAMANQEKKQEQTKEQTLSSKQLNYIKNLIEGIDSSSILAMMDSFGVKKIGDLGRSQASSFIEQIKELKGE